MLSKETALRFAKKMTPLYAGVFQELKAEGGRVRISKRYAKHRQDLGTYGAATPENQKKLPFQKVLDLANRIRKARTSEEVSTIQYSTFRRDRQQWGDVMSLYFDMAFMAPEYFEEIMAGGLHAYLESIRRQCAQIHTAVNQVYVTYAIESALEV